jgi:hypothetical protein
MKKSFFTFLIIALPLLSFAESTVVWQGGLWNLDYPGDISTYGHFRLLIEPDVMDQGFFILRVEWIENLDSKGERLYASRLIPELGRFLDSRNISAKMGEVPSAIRLVNSKGKALWLRLWEPTRFEIQEKFK